MTPRAETMVRIAEATGILIAGALLVRGVGLLKEVLVASRFGVGPEMDAFAAALLLPTLVSGALVGAMQVSLIPVFVETRARGGEGEALGAFWTLAGLLGLVSGGLAVLMAAAGPFVMGLVAPGLAPASKALASGLLVLVASLLVLNVIAGLFSALLNAYERFLLAAVAPAATSAITIAFLLFAPGLGIWGLALGTTLGTVAQGLVLLWGLRPGYGRGGGWRWGLRHPAVRQVGRLARPILAASLLIHVGPLVDQWLASRLGTGSIAALNYALRLVDVPSQLFIAALASAALPFLSQQASAGDLQGLRDSFARSLKLSAFALVPLTVGIGVLAEPLVRLAFERGAFDRAATGMVASLAVLFGLNVVNVVYAYLIARVFSAMQETITFTVGTAVYLATKIPLTVLLVSLFGLPGIAAGTFLGFLATNAVTSWFLSSRLGHLRGTGLIPSGLRTVAAAAVMAAVTWLGVLAFPGRIPAAGLAAVAGAGLAVYLGTSWLLRSEEFGLVADLARRTLARPARA